MARVLFDIDNPTVGLLNIGVEEVKGLEEVKDAGALLPDPTTRNYHPYGLSSYALTYTGYQLFENLIAYRKP